MAALAYVNRLSNTKRDSAFGQRNKYDLGDRRRLSPPNRRLLTPVDPSAGPSSDFLLSSLHNSHLFHALMINTLNLIRTTSLLGQPKHIFVRVIRTPLHEADRTTLCSSFIKSDSFVILPERVTPPLMADKGEEYEARRMKTSKRRTTNPSMMRRWTLSSSL